MKTFSIIVVAAIFGAASPAHAQMVSAQSPASVAAAMKKAGFTADLQTDSTGDPMIRSAVNGHPFRVVFYGCKGKRDCATITFAAGYDKTSPTALESINEWNRQNRFGRAYLDAEGDPILGMDIDLDDGGISTALFTDNLQFWTAVTGSFQKHIGW